MSGATNIALTAIPYTTIGIYYYEQVLTNVGASTVNVYYTTNTVGVKYNKYDNKL